MNKYITPLLMMSITYANASNIESQIKTMLPSTPIDKVTQINTNISEAIAGDNSFFIIQGNESQLIVGHLINIQTGTDLTQQRLDDVKSSKYKFSQLPLDLALKVGNGKNKIAVFIDPDCPYCRKYEELINKNIKDLTVYYFMLPLAMHPNALTHSQQILCAKEPRTAIEKIMINGQDYDAKASQKCIADATDKINKIASLTSSLGINGTPLSITNSNTVINGYDVDGFNKFVKGE